MLICTRVVQFIAKAISINCLLDNKHLVGNHEVWFSVFLISLGCRSFVYSLYNLPYDINVLLYRFRDLLRLLMVKLLSLMHILILKVRLFLLIERHPYKPSHKYIIGRYSYTVL